MTLIKCPQCGQTVLSVATTCPKCHHLLTQNPLQQGGDSNLVDCRRCHKIIPVSSVTCEYCGYPVRFRRRLRRVGWTAVAVAALTLVAIVAAQFRPGSPDNVSAVQSIPIHPPGGANMPTAALKAADTAVAAAPGGARAAAAAAPRPFEIPDSLRPPPGASVRYLITWGNVRVARDTVSPAMQAVAPGTAVLAARPMGGWFAVYIDSVFAGYVAGDLLSREPPDSTTIFDDYR